MVQPIRMCLIGAWIVADTPVTETSPMDRSAEPQDPANQNLRCETRLFSVGC
jgi:hypothetical protein